MEIIAYAITKKAINRKHYTSEIYQATGSGEGLGVEVILKQV